MMGFLAGVTAAVIAEMIRAARAGRQAPGAPVRSAPSLPTRPQPARGEPPPPWVEDEIGTLTRMGDAAALRADRKRRRDRDLMDLWHREAQLIALAREFARAAQAAGGGESLPRELRESASLIRLLELPRDADPLLASAAAGSALLFCATLRKVADRRSEGSDRVRDLRDLPALAMLPELTRRVLGQAGPETG